jgi:glutaredoxin
MMRILTILFAALLVLPGVAAAQRMYKWIDGQGNVSYHDRPPPAGSEYRVEERSIKRAPSRGGESSAEAAAQSPVVLYVVPKCAPCDTARSHLQRRNVPFSEKNVEKDLKLQDELKKKVGALTVPALTIGNKVMNSYSEGWLDSELDLAGYAKTGEGTATAEQPEEKPAEDTGFRAPTQ